MSSAAVFFSVVTALVMLASGAFDFTMPPKVLDLMERMPPGPVHKEDGELIIDKDGQRVA